MKNYFQHSNNDENTHNPQLFELSIFRWFFCNFKSLIYDSFVVVSLVTENCVSEIFKLSYYIRWWKRVNLKGGELGEEKSISLIDFLQPHTFIINNFYQGNQPGFLRNTVETFIQESFERLAWTVKSRYQVFS